MRAYGPTSEEAQRSRSLLRDWKAEGLITASQHEQMMQDLPCELRRNNFFLRFVLFFFTAIVVAALIGLLFLAAPGHETTGASGVLLLFIAGICYFVAEVAVSSARLYRYGIEEALLACAVALLCVGMEMAFFSGSSLPAGSHSAEFLVPAAGIAASLWIFYRFGLSYAPLAAMVFVIWLAAELTSSRTSRHLIVAGFYACALLFVTAIRSRERFSHRDDEYSIFEALLWMGAYLAMNLQLSSLDLLQHWWTTSRHAVQFPGAFYWATWALTWFLPPIVLMRGLRRKDRLIIAVGIISAVLTLATNKPYLGWKQQSWDPMLLGVLLIGLALLVRRWLSASPGGIRHGFTAQRISGKEHHWLNAAAIISAVVSAESITLAPERNSGVHFGGGDAGGGGASSDF